MDDFLFDRKTAPRGFSAGEIQVFSAARQSGKSNALRYFNRGRKPDWTIETNRYPKALCYRTPHYMAVNREQVRNFRERSAEGRVVWTNAYILFSHYSDALLWKLSK